MRSFQALVPKLSRFFVFAYNETPVGLKIFSKNRKKILVLYPKQHGYTDAILHQHWLSWRNPAPDTQYGYNVDVMLPNQYPAAQYWYSIAAILNNTQPSSAECYPAMQYGYNPDAILPNRLPVMLDSILLCSMDAMLTQSWQTVFLLLWMASYCAVWMQCWRITAKQGTCYAEWHLVAQYGCNADAILPNRPFLSCDPVLRQCCPEIDT